MRNLELKKETIQIIPEQYLPFKNQQHLTFENQNYLGYYSVLVVRNINLVSYETGQQSLGSFLILLATVFFSHLNE